jgi:hypothetical protein
MKLGVNGELQYRNDIPPNLNFNSCPMGGIHHGKRLSVLVFYTLCQLR